MHRKRKLEILTRWNLGKRKLIRDVDWRTFHRRDCACGRVHIHQMMGTCCGADGVASAWGHVTHWRQYDVMLRRRYWRIWTVTFRWISNKERTCTGIYIKRRNFSLQIDKNVISTALTRYKPNAK